MPFCAPPTDRTEAIVPVQIGGYFTALASALITLRIPAVAWHRVARRGPIGG
jgi:hypothetical protein